MESLLNRFEDLVQRMERAQGGSAGGAGAKKAQTVKESYLAKDYEAQVLSKVKDLQDKAAQMDSKVITSIVNTPCSFLSLD